MPDHGDQLGVDLNELYVVAHYLTKVADDYTRASKLVSSCAPPTVSAPWTDVVPEWPLLRFEVSDILQDTARNLTDTAKALNDNADNYASTDQCAAAEFNKLKAQDAATEGEGW
jgi:hypothetical protein